MTTLAPATVLERRPAPALPGSARLALQALAVPATMLAFDVAVRAAFTVRVNDRLEPGPYLLALLASYGFGLAAISLAALLRHRAPRAARVLTLLFAAVYALLCFSNLLVYRYFGEYVFPSALDFVIHDGRYLIDYLLTFGGPGPLLGFLAACGGFYFMLAPRSAPPPGVGWPLAAYALLGSTVFATGLKVLDRRTDVRLPPDTVTFVSVSKHLVKVRDATRPLRPSERLAVRPLGAPARPPPRTVVVVVNESMGVRDIGWLGAPRAGMPRLERRMAAEPERFVRFASAFTSAGATAVSMSSLFSGVSPEESYEKLHRLPMLWDLARARRFRTAYVTSQRLRWACLSDFLLQQPIDVVRSVENLKAPIVNDMGMDDQVSAAEVVRLLEETPRETPLFVLYNTNALHAPFQSESQHVDLSGVEGDRYARALYLVDAALERIFEGLARSGRLEDAWVISTSDHGETPEPSHGVPRISSFFDEILRVPLWMWLPASWAADAELRGVLAANAGRNVSNLDLAPTVADGLGVELAVPPGPEGGWRGVSWLSPVPEERVLVALNTNATRLWDREGFGLIRGVARLVCHEGPGCQLFRVDRDPAQRTDLLSTEQAASLLPPFLEAIDRSPELQKIWAYHRRAGR